MQATMEIAELDELVAHLDARISEVEVAEDKAAPSAVLICTLGCGGGYSWHYPYC